MAKKIFTYKTIPDDVIQVGWKVYGRPIPESREIKAWRKNLDLQLTTEIFINVEEFNKYLFPGCNFSFYVVWNSLAGENGTSLQNCCYSCKYDHEKDDKIKEFCFDSTIPGEKIAGTIEISLIVAISNSINTIELSTLATKKGTMVYKTSEVLHLEGGQALFPVKAVAFSMRTGIAKHSLYYLKKKYTDLDSNFNAAYTLFFNTEHPLFKKINSDVENDLAVNYLLKMIMFDVYRTIIYDALDYEHGLTEFVETLDFDSATVKAVYSKILSEVREKYFPEKDLKALKLLAHGTENERNLLYTAIQEYIFGDEK